jgi:hypothetical protein
MPVYPGAPQKVGHSPGSPRKSSWISSLNGSSFDGRSGQRNPGGTSDLSAVLIVLRASPVRRINSLIETPRTKCSLRSSAHRSTSSTPLPGLDNTIEPGSTRPRTPPPPPEGGQISTGEEGSISHRRRHPLRSHLLRHQRFCTLLLLQGFQIRRTWLSPCLPGGPFLLRG